MSIAAVYGGGGGGGGVSVRKRKTDDIHSVMIHKNTEDRE